MTITLPLEPQTEARLKALARQRGVTADELVREAVDKLIAEVPEPDATALPVWPLGAAPELHRRDIYDDVP